MAAPASAPCEPWATWAQVTAICSPPTIDDSIKPLILAAVTRELWTKTCRQFGICEATVRPVPCCVHYWHHRFCSCARYVYVELSREPIASVTEVLIDGVVLDPSAYRVDDFGRLVRIDGDIWPRCNDLGVDSTEDRTFEVTFTFGAEIPAEGVLAAALIACRWASSIATGDCEVPPNTTSVSREGVTIELHPPSLSTGNTLVDEWLAGFECASAGIFDPGARRRFVRAGT